MSDTRLTRRRVLRGAAGLAGAASLAGCSAQAAASLEPRLPASRLHEAGWYLEEEIDETTTETVDIGGTTQRVELEVLADVYANDGPVERAADKLGVDQAHLADLPGEAFVAAKARLDPPVHRLASVSSSFLVRAMDLAEAEAERSLEDQGFRDVRRLHDGTLRTEAGSTARHRVYRADYPYDAFETTHAGHEVRAEPGRFTVEAQLAVWPAGGLLVSGAGVYPGEAGELAVSIGGDRGTLHLGFEPERYREDVRGLIRQIA